MELTQEQKFKFRYRMEQEEEAAAIAAPAVEEVVEKPADDGLDSQDIRGGIGALNKAMTLGFGDEIVGKVRSWLPDSGYDFGSDVSSEEQSSEDAYKMYRDDVRASDREFADENPGTNLAIQLGAGILNPLNKVGGGGGLLKAMGRAGVEGAAFGAGEAEELEDIPLDMAKGGLAAGVTSGALGGLGRAVGRRNVAQKLDGADGSFTPIHMTSGDSTLASAYRQGLGRVIGSGAKLRGQQKSIIEGAKDAVGDATMMADEISGQTKSALNKTIAGIDTKAARRAIDEAIPDSMPTEMVAKVQGAKTATEAEEILSAWWGKDGFKSITGIKSLDVPENLTSSVKSSIKQNPEMADFISPAMMEGFEDLAGKSVSGKQFLEIRNSFARAANKTPSMKGKSARAFATKFDNILKKQLGADSPAWKAYKSELKSWGPKQALTKSAKQARKTGRDVTAGDVAKQATDKTKLQKMAGTGVANQAKLKKALTAAELKQNPAIIKANEGLAKAKAKASEVGGRKAPKGSGISEFLTTSALGAGVAPLGIAVGKGLTSKQGQRIVAGQTGVQRALKKAMIDGDMDRYNKILARLAAQGQTGE